MKYCKYCGRQLQDNESCTCEDAVREKKESGSEADLTTEINPFAPGNHTAATNEVSDQTQPELTIQETAAASQTVMAETLSIPQEETSKNSKQASNASASEAKSEKTEKSQKKSESMNVFKTALGNVLPYLKAFIKAPASAVTVSTENTDLPLTGILYALYVISLVLFETIGMSKLWKSISTLIGGFFYGGSGKISYPWLILCSLLTGILILVITNLLLVIVGACSHSKYNFKQILAGASGIFIYPTICFLLAAIVVLFSARFAFVILCMGYVAYLLVTYFTIKTLFQKNENSSFLLISILIITALCLLTAFTSAKLGSSFSKKIMKSDSHYDNSIEDLFKYYE